MDEYTTRELRMQLDELQGMLSESLFDLLTRADNRIYRANVCEEQGRPERAELHRETAIYLLRMARDFKNKYDLDAEWNDLLAEHPNLVAFAHAHMIGGITC